MKIIYRSRFFILLSLLTGCTVGPKYETPSIPVPTEWHSQLCEDTLGDSPDCFLWWEALKDPVLNSLLEEAAMQNLDLYIAGMRILEARAQLKGGSSGFYPHIDGSAAYGHAQFDQKILKPVLGSDCSGRHKRHVNFFEAGFDAEWELDLFGITRHEICALKARMESSEEDFSHIWVTLSAEVARNYVELRGLQWRLEVLKNNMNAQRDTLELTQGLVKSGFASLIDEREAEEQLHLLSGQKPLLELSLSKTIHRLSVLLGRAPGELFEKLIPICSLPCLPCQKPIGVPSELLRRRPDIRKAERDLAAATEDVGTAVASLFPRLSLNGFVGDIGTLCTGGSLAWFAGPQLLVPFFNSKLLRQDVEVNQIKAQQALYNYQKTVLEALEETENALSSLHAEKERNQHLFNAQKASQEAYDLTMQLYQRGMKNYLEALVLQRSMLAAEDSYLQGQVQLLLHYISLYKALGGGWDIDYGSEDCSACK